MFQFLVTPISFQLGFLGTSSGFRGCKDIFMSHDLRAHHQEDLSVNAEEQRGNLPVLEEHPWLGSPPFMSQKNAIWKGSHNPRTWGLAKQPLLSTTCINESWVPILQVSADPAERWDTTRIRTIFKPSTPPCEN